MKTLLGFASLFCATLFAGVSVEMAVTGGHQGNYQYYVDGPNLRVDQATNGTSRPFLLWRGKEQRILFLNHEEKKYMEMTAAQIKELAAKSKEMMKLSKQMMGALPPEARKEIEKMEGKMNAKREFKKGGTKKVGEWNCTQYSVVAGKETVSELCTVPLETLGVSRADFQALEMMKPFYETMGPSGPGSLGVEWGADLNLGFPVETIHMGYQGSKATTTRVVKVARVNHPAEYVSVPAGYQKASAPAMPNFPSGKKPKKP